MGILPLHSYASSSSDTIPPIFTTLPQDIQVNCEDPILESFETWYGTQALSVADNGDAQVFPTLPQMAAIDSLDQSLELGCNGTGTFTMGFFAVDSCGNNSDSTYLADFSVVDLSPPSFLVPASDKEISCIATARDTLQNWIDIYGRAIATDLCGDSVTWTNYSWEDNQGNSGFSTFEDSTNIVIARDSCFWSVTVSFFAADFCGNSNVTTASFSITEDTERPIITFVPADVTIACSDTIPTNSAIIVDACDGTLSIETEETNNQPIDTLACEHYNYDIIRRWSAQDICGNTMDTFQTISVSDTIAPEIIAETSIAVDCDTDLTSIGQFATAVDNCSQAALTFTDDEIFNSNCQRQIERKWFATDICGNRDSFIQIIQVQDFNGPEFITLPSDTLIFCNATNIDVVFDNWVTRIAGATLTDNCSQYSVKGLDANVYSDTTEIVNATIPVLKMNDCNNVFGALSTQQVSFVAFDDCGNISQREALFSIIDPAPPIVSNCPSNFLLQLDGNDCTADHSLTLPDFSDNCLTDNEANWRITINEKLILTNANDGELLKLEIGENIIEYTIIDCGGNSDSCQQLIEVNDIVPPTLECPSDQTIYLDNSSCSVLYENPALVSYDDNCAGISIYEETLPSIDGLIEFEFNPFSQIYQAPDFRVFFENIILPESVHEIRLEAEYRLDLTQGSSIIIQGENNQALLTINNSSCLDQISSTTISENLLNLWLADSRVQFTAINNVSNGQGTLSCMPANINGQKGSDGESYLRLRMIITELLVTEEITTASIGTTDTITGPLLLNVDNYLLTYSSNDASSNTGQCQTNITVADTLAPAISCEDIVYSIDPLLEGFYPVLERDLDFSAEDNCEVADINFEPRQIFCSDLGSNLEYVISAEDIHGNESQCNASIEIVLQELNPEFLSGLCFDDTLKLISNIPNNIGFQVSWTGPNNFSSNNLNPTLIGITEAATGVYTIEALNTSGCTFSSTLDIDVNEFDSPEIFTLQNSICQGETVLLNTTSFTETVDYFWYEGISPNGTLVGQTSGPSITLTPILGDHFYYVEAKGNNCNSSPSNTLEINVSPPPIAEINDPFRTLCEGDNLLLTTETTGAQLSYEWIGPNNYNSQGAIPETINDVTTSNQGTYNLVVKQGACISDTASAQVIVFENPDLPVIEGEAIFCEGQTAVLTVPNIPNGTRFSWYRDGVFFSSVNSNSLLIPSIASDQSGAWTVVAEEGICTSDTSSAFVIDVESSLNIGATNNGPHCEGDSVLLTSSFIPNASYSWEDPNGLTYDGRIITTLAIEGVYTVTITTASNCVAITNTSLVVGNRPEITALSNTSLPCMSGDMPITLVPTIFPPGNYTYQWTGPNNFSSNALQPIITNADENDNGVYTLNVIQGNCASLASTTEVDISVIPAAAILNANTDPCEGDEVTIEITNPVNGNQISWLWNTPNGQVTSSEPRLNIDNFSSADNGAYTVIQERNSCRSILSSEAFIEIQTEPIVPIISGNNILCEGEQLVLSVQEQTADEYFWFTPTGTLSQSSNQLIIENTKPEDAGSYTAYYREGNCESETSTPFQVVVQGIPPAPSFDIDSLSFCSSELETTEICVEVLSSNFDNIRLIEENTGTTLSQTETTCFDLDFLLAAGNTQINLVAILEKDGCISNNNDAINIEVFEALTSGAEVTEKLMYVCTQDFISITADFVPEDVQLEWVTNNPDINIFDSNSATASFNNLEQGVNQIQLITRSGNCPETFIDEITVIRISSISAIDDVYDLAFNQVLSLDITENDVFSENIIVNIISAPENGIIEVSDNSSLSYTPPTGFVGTESVVYEICYEDCINICSQAEINLTIGENVACFVGNVITPNADGYNDILMVPCLENSSFAQNSITILNQWGDEVYSAAPYKNDWAGDYRGKTLPSGTYFYILDLGDGSKPLQGFITLEP